jgi:6-phosphogluconolactonase
MRFIIVSLLIMVTNNLMSQELYLFAGTYTNGKSEGIYVFKFDTRNGSIKKVSSIASENPSYLAISKNKKYLYAANENGDGKGGVSAFSFNEKTGKLTKLNQQLSHGDHPCYIAVDPSDKWVAVGNYSGGNFSVYPVQENGGIGEAAQTIAHTGGSVDKSRQEGPHVHSTVFTPDGSYLVVTDLGTDKIMAYPFNASSSKPVVDPANIQVSSTPGSGPRHIVFHPTSPYAYVIEEMSGNVAAYSTTNPGEALQIINSHPENYKGSIGSAAIKISNDGKFLYASNRGESNTVAAFKIDEQSGKLSLQGFIESGGKGPRDFAIDPTDSYILIANGESDNVTIYKRDKQSGLPVGKGVKTSLPSPVCLVFY